MKTTKNWEREFKRTDGTMEKNQEASNLYTTTSLVMLVGQQNARACVTEKEFRLFV